MTEHVRTEYKGSESLPAGLTGKHLRRFPAAPLQNPRPQSPSSALISSYRHGACGRALPGSQTLSSATAAVEQRPALTASQNAAEDFHFRVLTAPEQLFLV